MTGPEAKGLERGIGVKRYPACASTHQALDATLALAEEHAIAASAVEAPECAVHSRGH